MLKTGQMQIASRVCIYQEMNWNTMLKRINVVESIRYIEISGQAGEQIVLDEATKKAVSSGVEELKRS